MRCALVCAVAVEGDNGRVAAMVVKLSGRCQPAAVGGCGTGQSTALGTVLSQKSTRVSMDPSYRL